MTRKRLEPYARRSITLEGLYNAAEALCGIFVSVYLWVNSHDAGIVFRHYLTLYAVTPFVFILAGWYSQSRDRLHVYRIGLIVHALYYASLLCLRETAPQYAVHLGALLGVAWGTYYAGANTFSFDFTTQGNREYYLGLSSAIGQSARLLAPLAGGMLIRFAPERALGYELVFAAAVTIYTACFLLSLRLPPNDARRPFRILRALFPAKDKRDWRYVMLASFTLAGAFHIFTFLLAMLMFIQTNNELSVGGYESFQAIVGIVISYTLARRMTARTRKWYMLGGALLLLAAGLVLFAKINVTMLLIFALLRSAANPLFGIAHSSVRLDIIAKTVEEPRERIEYLCAWEVPLAVGRVIMLLTMIGLYGWLSGNELALKLGVLLLCSLRLLTYYFMMKTDEMRAAPAPH